MTMTNEEKAYRRTVRKNRKKWTEALRSGKYKQGREALRTKSGRFCCLGVWCDVENPKAWEKEVKPLDNQHLWGFRIEGYSFPRFSDLNSPQLRALGLDSHDQCALIEFNDRKGKYHKNFEEIADYVDSLPIRPMPR